MKEIIPHFFLQWIIGYPKQFAENQEVANRLSDEGAKWIKGYPNELSIELSDCVIGYPAREN